MWLSLTKRNNTTIRVIEIIPSFDTIAVANIHERLKKRRVQQNLKLGRLIALPDVIMTSSLCFCDPSVKLEPDNLCTALKLCRLISFDKFHKICRFENHVTTNDVIMMSLLKTMEKCGCPRNQSNYVSFERLSRELSNKCTFYQI